MSQATRDEPTNYRDAGAHIEGDYRYRLWRVWDDGPTCTFIMLNPSTADALEDDPTIRKCVGFAKRWGCGRLEVVNLFAYRATDPREIYNVSPGWAVGPSNDHAIMGATYQADLVVCAWGNHGGLHRRADAVLELIADHCTPMALSRTKRDQPGHPLYLPYETELFAWSEREL